MKKFCDYLREHTRKIIKFKHLFINKRVAGIISELKKLPYLSQKI